ncbi:MAG: hypothetical protein Q9162_006575 [Coniocarpon cinnabarinum]
MAPPPPADMPLAQRLMALAETLQFGWFCGHVTMLLCALSYGLTYITFRTASGWARFNYRTAYVAAAATYSIVVYKSFRARARQGKGGQSPLALVADENVQYLGELLLSPTQSWDDTADEANVVPVMSVIWLFSFQVPLALAPLAVYALFHVASYTRSNLLPTLQPQPQGAKPSGLSEAMGKFVRDYYDTSMTIVAFLEILLWFRLLFSAIVFTRGSWILLMIYTVFFRARYSQSSFMQSAIMQMTARIDNALANPNTPPAAKNAWEQAKGAIRQAVDATDFNRAAARQANAQPKKAQ